MRQVAHAEVGAECDASAIVVLAACDDAQKGTFPGSVFGNYAYLYDLEKRIRRERSLPENLRPSFVMKNGGTNTAAAILVCIAYTLVSLVFTFIMVHI